MEFTNQYKKIGWKNKSESLSTPLTENNLNHMDNGIYKAHEAIEEAYRELKTDIDLIKLLGFSIDNEGYVIQTIEEEE